MILRNFLSVLVFVSFCLFLDSSTTGQVTEKVIHWDFTSFDQYTKDGNKFKNTNKNGWNCSCEIKVEKNNKLVADSTLTKADFDENHGLKFNGHRFLVIDNVDEFKQMFPNPKKRGWGGRIEIVLQPKFDAIDVIKKDIRPSNYPMICLGTKHGNPDEEQLKDYITNVLKLTGDEFKAKLAQLKANSVGGVDWRLAANFIDPANKKVTNNDPVPSFLSSIYGTAPANKTIFPRTIPNHSSWKGNVTMKFQWKYDQNNGDKRVYFGLKSDTDIISVDLSARGSSWRWDFEEPFYEPHPEPYHYWTIGKLQQTQWRSNRFYGRIKSIKIFHIRNE